MQIAWDKRQLERQRIEAGRAGEEIAGCSLWSFLRQSKPSVPFDAFKYPITAYKILAPKN